MRAVEPEEFNAFTWAPASIKACIIKVFPLCAAADIGVTPFLFDTFVSTPCIINSSTAKVFWNLTAWVRTVSSY